MKIKAIVICFLLIIFFIFFQNVRLSPIINDESIKYSFDPIEKVWFESNAGVGEVLLDSTYQKIFFASSGSSGSGGCPDGSTSCGSVCCDSSHPCCGTFCCNENHQCANSNLGICCHNSYTVCNDGPPYSWLPPGSGPSSYCCPQGQTCNKGVCKEICQPDEEECNGSCCAGDCLDTPSGKKCCSEGDVICGDSCCGPNEECDYQKICNSGYCVSSSNIGGDLVCKPIDSCNNNDDCSCPNGQEMCNGSCCDIGKCGPQKICSTVFGFNVCLTTPQDVCNPINQCNNSIDCGCPNGEIMCNGSCCAGTCGKNYLCNASGVCVADGDDVCNPSNTCGSSCPCPSGQVMCNGSCCAGTCGKSSFCDLTGACTTSNVDVCNPSNTCGSSCPCPSGQVMCNGSCCAGSCGKSYSCIGVKCTPSPNDVCNPSNTCGSSCPCPSGQVMCNGSCCAGTCGKNYLCNASGVCVADGDDVCNPSNTCGSSCPCPSGQVMCNGSCCAGSCGKSSFCDFALGLCVYSTNDECNPSIMCGVDAQCSSPPPDCPEECPDNCGYSSYCLGEKCYYDDTLVCNPIEGCFNDSTCVLGKCGNGKADAGEMCGEPGLSCPSNNFDCINCECICSSPEIICGNDCCLASECVNGVCVGGEECELPEVECGNDCCLASECVNGVCVGGGECELPNIVCEDGSCCSPDQCAIKNICIDGKCKPSLTKTCFPGCESDAECIIGSGKFWDNSCGWNTPGFLFNINNIEEISGEIFFDLNYICSKPNILSLELNNASSPKKNIFLGDNLSCNLNNNSIKIKSTNLEGLHEICFTLGNNMPCCVFKNIKLKQDINIPDNNLISLVLFFVLIVGIIFVQNKKLKK